MKNSPSRSCLLTYICENLLRVSFAYACFVGSVTQLHATDIAVFFALDADLKTLAAKAKTAGQPTKLGTRVVHRLEICGHRVYAIKMGSGVVETAISATTLLTRFRCDLAFSVGPVGALDDEVAVGTWYEVGKTVGYQRGAWTPTGFEIAPTPEYLTQTESKKWRDRLALVDPLSGAKTVSVASGEIFVSSSTYREQLRAITRAQAVDMNLFGLESACAGQNVPLFSWRIASDRADDGAGESFRKFVAAYNGSGGNALADVISRLPPDPDVPGTYPELKKLLHGSQ